MGTRAVSIPRFLADMLEEQLQERSLPGPDGLVFPNTVGKPLVESSFHLEHVAAGAAARRDRAHEVS